MRSAVRCTSTKATARCRNPGRPPLPVNYLPAHPFNTTLLPDQRDETNVSGVWKNRDERTIRNERGRYFACCENLDTQIGRVLRKLEAQGELIEEQMRNAGSEFRHFESALKIAERIGNGLAVLA